MVLLKRIDVTPYISLEFGKSREMRVKSVPTSHFYTPINVTRLKASQFFNLASQRGKVCPIFQFGVPTCQKACHFFEFRLPKDVPIFQLFFKRIIFF